MSSAQVKAAREGILSTLEQELDTVILNEMHKWLWLVAKKSSRHIDSLHEHVLKNRTITIAENPALHLVWFYDRVYLKPIPRELLNYSFWIKYLLPQVAEPNQTAQERQRNHTVQSFQSSQQTSWEPQDQGQDHWHQVHYEVGSLSHACRTTLGFLRSYSLLIQHESDFSIAQDSKILPSTITYSEFEDFIGAFRFIDDEAVSKRYTYGQFRLTRLNWAVRLCRPSTMTKKTKFPWYYQEMRWQTGDYLRDYGAVAVFIFAMISLILSSLQVMLTAQTFTTWSGFTEYSWVFSIGVLVSCAVLIFIIITGIVITLLIQARFAMAVQWKAGSRKAIDMDA